MSHQLWPIPMKIGTNVLREHFDIFLIFICPEVPEEIPPDTPKLTNKFGWLPQDFGEKNAENAEKMRNMQNMHKNAPGPNP